MPTTEEIITAAAAEAEGGDDLTETVDTGEETPSSDSEGKVAEIEVSPSAGTTEAKPEIKIVEPDELTKELEALGIKAPKEGERENRLPYSRVRKIVENARKKLVEAHTSALGERDGKLTKAEEELKNFRSADELFRNDPERYIQTLAVLNPAYRKYVGTAPVVEKPVVAAVAVPMPEPDLKYEDGSLGYSPKQHAELLKWNRQEAVTEATEKVRSEYEKRFGPIEQQWKANQIVQEQQPKIKSQLAGASKTWGKLFDEDYAKGDQSEVLKAMRENNGENGRPFLSFDACVAQVLTPKLRSDRDTIRAEYRAELNARPKAAVKTTPAAVKTVTESTDARTSEDIIRETIAAAGLKF